MPHLSTLAARNWLREKSNMLFPLKSPGLMLRMIFVKGENKVYLGILVQFIWQSETTGVEWCRRCTHSLPSHQPGSHLWAERVCTGPPQIDLSAAACETCNISRGNQLSSSVSELSPCCVFSPRRDPFENMDDLWTRHSPCTKMFHCLLPLGVDVSEIGHLL